MPQNTCDVPCPYCRVGRGEPCVTSAGKRARRMHERRMDEARRAHFYRPSSCTGADVPSVEHDSSVKRDTLSVGPVRYVCENSITFDPPLKRAPLAPLPPHPAGSTGEIVLEAVRTAMMDGRLTVAVVSFLCGLLAMAVSGGA